MTDKNHHSDQNIDRTSIKNHLTNDNAFNDKGLQNAEKTNKAVGKRKS